MGRAASAERRGRAPYLLLAAASLVAGLWAALARIGIPIGAPDTVWEAHGLVMTLGFLGTVISLERAVAIGRAPAFAAPALAGLGGMALLGGVVIAPLLLLSAGFAFLLVCAYMWRVRPEFAMGAMALGAVAWVIAAAALLSGTTVSRIVPLLATFLVLTIAGERVGLSKIAHPPGWSRIPFVLGSALLLTGAAVAVVVPDATRVAGIGLLLLAAWLGLWDFAWRSVRRSGLTRYMAVALLVGYAWLAVGGLTWLVVPDAATAFAYDALIHSIFVGFVLSMIFAHELMILPALTGVALPFTRAFYVPLALLHVSLAARIAGDALSDTRTWQWAALANVLAVLLLAGLSAFAALRARSRRGGPADHTGG